MSWTWIGKGAPGSSSTSTNWNTASNWSNTNGTGATVPSSAFDGTVNIPVGSVIVLTSAEAFSALNINGSASITGSQTITANSFTIAAGATATFGATTHFSLNGGANGAILMSGSGTAIISGGTFSTGNTINIASGQTLELEGSTVSAGNGGGGKGTIILNGTASLTTTNAGPTETISFAGTGNTLTMPGYANGVVIQNFGYGDTINAGGNALKLVANGTGSPYTLETTGGTTLGTVSLAAGTPGAGGAPAGSANNITLTNTSGNDTYPCFYPGTMLATETGEIAVEDVVAGTMLKTAAGEILPVRWLGWSEVSTVFADPLKMLPIRIKAGALADGVPARDLLVSPDHALFLDGILVQAGALVNCTSILREPNVPQNFRYYHVELASHELLLAEACAAESFVDNIDRMNFHNWDARAEPFAPVMEMPLPRAKSNRQLPASLHQALAARAARFAAPQAA